MCGRNAEISDFGLSYQSLFMIIIRPDPYAVKHAAVHLGFQDMRRTEIRKPRRQSFGRPVIGKSAGLDIITVGQRGLGIVVKFTLR